MNAREEFGAKDPRSWSAVITCHTSGLSLTAQQPVNNIVRGTLQSLALVMAGAVSGEPDPRPPVSGFAARLLGELPDEVGFYHRDEIALLASRYERLRD